MENHSIGFQRVIKLIRKFTNPYGELIQTIWELIQTIWERIQYVWGTNPNPMGMNPKTLHKKTDPAAEDVIAAESGFRFVRLMDNRS